jgi:heme exporter protein A
MQLVADNLAVARGGRNVVANLSFTVEAGCALMLTGPNGSGKTTLIRAIAGLLAPSAGELRLDPHDPERELGEHCHYVGHQEAARSSLTVRENADFWRNFLAADRVPRAPDDRIDDALEAFGLLPLTHVPAGYLSAGQRRRLALARLLVCPRPLWLLDEPTTSLDADTRLALDRVINAHLAEGGLAVIATHAPMAIVQQRDLALALPAAGDA